MEDKGHKIDRKFIVVMALACVLTVAAFAVYLYPGRGVGYAPSQPIPFSHKLHAGDRKIDCKYCHTSVGRSAHSNIPSLNVCMNCHQHVKKDSPHIQRLTDAYNKGEPIHWVNVYVLPDFVYFNHERHIARGVSCANCHGNVQEMEKVYQANTLSMGWCVNCHREQEPPAPIECSTCHR